VLLWGGGFTKNGGGCELGLDAATRNTGTTVVTWCRLVNTFIRLWRHRRVDSWFKAERFSPSTLSGRSPPTAGRGGYVAIGFRRVSLLVSDPIPWRATCPLVQCYHQRGFRIS